MADVEIACHVNLDQPQVNGELSNLNIDRGSNSRLELGVNLLRDLGRSLGCELDCILDNVLGLKSDAGSVVLRAALVDDGSEVSAEIGLEVGLELQINLVLHSCFDGSAEDRGQFGAESEIELDEATIFELGGDREHVFKIQLAQQHGAGGTCGVGRIGKKFKLSSCPSL